MILGVGSDIIHIPRIAKAIENPRFVARVYTAGEIAYARGRGAGTLLDIEILPDALGAPQAGLTGAFAVRAAAMSVTRVWITLSHEKEYATAYCVLEGSL